MTLLRESEWFGVPHKKSCLLAVQVTSGEQNKADLMVLKTLQESTVMVFYCKWIIEIILSFNCVNSCS